MTALLSFQGVKTPLRGDVVGGPWTLSLPPGTAAAVRAAPSVSAAIASLCIGAEAPMEGEVLILGSSPASLPRLERNRLLRRIGIAFQREGLVSNLSLEENLTVPMVFGGHFPPREARARASEAIDELGIGAFRGIRPGTLPREVRIYAAIARAALRDPELLILEHLSSGLPDHLLKRVLSWCLERCKSMLVLVPGPREVLNDLAFDWFPPLSNKGGEESAG